MQAVCDQQVSSANVDAGELDLARIHMLYAMDTEKAPTDTESWLVKLDAALHFIGPIPENHKQA